MSIKQRILDLGIALTSTYFGVSYMHEMVKVFVITVVSLLTKELVTWSVERIKQKLKR